jgi:hypothetical protein
VCAPRLMLPLARSWDHRATDGVAVAGFLVHLDRSETILKLISVQLAESPARQCRHCARLSER